MWITNYTSQKNTRFLLPNLKEVENIFEIIVFLSCFGFCCWFPLNRYNINKPKYCEWGFRCIVLNTKLCLETMLLLFIISEIKVNHIYVMRLKDIWYKVHKSCRIVCVQLADDRLTELIYRDVFHNADVVVSKLLFEIKPKACLGLGLDLVNYKSFIFTSRTAHS